VKQRGITDLDAIDDKDVRFNGLQSNSKYNATPYSRDGPWLSTAGSLLPTPPTTKTSGSTDCKAAPNTTRPPPPSQVFETGPGQAPRGHATDDKDVRFDGLQLQIQRDSHGPRMDAGKELEAARAEIAALKASQRGHVLNFPNRPKNGY
jgi:hypothetical protein